MAELYDDLQLKPWLRKLDWERIMRIYNIDSDLRDILRKKRVPDDLQAELSRLEIHSTAVFLFMAHDERGFSSWACMNLGLSPHTDNAEEVETRKQNRKLLLRAWRSAESRIELHFIFKKCKVPKDLQKAFFAKLKAWRMEKSLCWCIPVALTPTAASS